MNHDDLEHIEALAHERGFIVGVLDDDMQAHSRVVIYDLAWGHHLDYVDVTTLGEAEEYMNERG